MFHLERTLENKESTHFLEQETEILSIFSKDKEFLAKARNELDLEARFLHSLCSLIQATGLNKRLQ